MTRQRMAILEELRKIKTHPSAPEIYEMQFVGACPACRRSSEDALEPARNFSRD